MKVMEYAWRLYFSMPPSVRQGLRIMLKGTAGHRSSIFNRMIAMRDAHGKCRIDNCARLFSDYLTASDINGLEGKRCLEIGTGYVGSSPVVMWLLGARAVTTVDMNRLWVPAALKTSILSVEKVELHDILRKYVQSEDSLRGRLDQIYAWAESRHVTLPADFSYLAPFDLVTTEWSGAFDFTFSSSTLEHIPRSIVGRFVEKMGSALTSGGAGLHFIDLADHLDREADPLGFLGHAAERYSDDFDADSRGNRIRGLEWLELFVMSGLNAEIVMSSRVPHSFLPGVLADPFGKMDSNDLLRTSVLVRIRKNSGSS